VELKRVSGRDASLTVNALTALGLVSNGSLPHSGLTIFLPSDAALNMLAKQLPGGSNIAASGTDPSAGWKKLTPECQSKISSVLLYHVVSSASMVPSATSVAVPTALALVYPGSNLELTDGGKGLKTGSGQKLKLPDPRAICGNFAYIIPQVLIPTPPTKIPSTPLDQAVGVLRALATRP